MKKTVKVLRVLNVPRSLCEHLVGEHHSTGHQMAAGTVVMLVGVGIAYMGGQWHNIVWHFVCDGVGYAVLGLGAVPFIEYLISSHKDGSELEFPELHEQLIDELLAAEDAGVLLQPQEAELVQQMHQFD